MIYQTPAVALMAAFVMTIMVLALPLSALP
jgi:hypothetical protein